MQVLTQNGTTKITSAARQRLTVYGIVQGVGFRPFVYRLAQSLALSGWVRNDGNGVTVDIQGPASALAEFHFQLHASAPPLARIDRVETLDIVELNRLDSGFSILQSDAGGGQAAIGADSAICDACLAELFDPDNRRFRYPLINCTDCGPRYTLVHRLPYDRANTSMAAFPQCTLCLGEYTDPGTRRFHAEPNACPTCGPQLQFLDRAAQTPCGDPIQLTLQAITRGEIVAIKGLGGFHLVCDAKNTDAVARLRQRKQRPDKPLAIMAANARSLHPWVETNQEEIATLESRERPIVLLRKTRRANQALIGVAPGVAWLGAMLPYTPLHYLLFHQAAGAPNGTDWLTAEHPLLLVMTSANARGEPLVCDNQEALEQLAGIADAWLLHDRAIVTRCDDSVVRHPHNQGMRFVRRARGYTPRALNLARSGPPVLALGAHFNNTLCLTRGAQAFVSQHIGDLDRVANCQALEAAVEHFCHLLEVRPEAVAHDLHPDFFSTRLALQLAERWQIPAIAVQHHHAHIAALLAEQQIEQPVLALALDGVGLGTDGNAWGGELLQVDGAKFQRLGHLRHIALPGGDRAAREPWRMAAAALALMGRHADIAPRFATIPAAQHIAQLLRPGHRLALTSSMGRWFDAAAGILGVRSQISFEGQAAMLLEGLAEQYGECKIERSYHAIDGQQLNLTPLLAQLTEMTDAAHGAALFHQALIQALVDWVDIAAQSSGIRMVACGGGCFVNQRLAQGLQAELARRDIRVLLARQLPSGDGGLSLGQAWVAQRSLARDTRTLA